LQRTERCTGGITCSCYFCAKAEAVAMSWEDEEKADPSGVDSKIAWADKKVPLQMIPLKALYGAARVFAYGRKKHGAGNFLRATMKDGAGERYAGADLRHLSERQNLNGIWDDKSLAARDEESGLPHIDHEIATLLMKRAILVKEGVLPLDPGEGKEPPKK